MIKGTLDARVAALSISASGCPGRARRARPSISLAALAAALVLAFALSFPTLALAAPANDDFANAEVLTGTTDSASGTNVDATKETGEPDHDGNTGGASVWYPVAGAQQRQGRS